MRRTACTSLVGIGMFAGLLATAALAVSLNLAHWRSFVLPLAMVAAVMLLGRLVRSASARGTESFLTPAALLFDRADEPAFGEATHSFWRWETTAGAMSGVYDGRAARLAIRTWDPGGDAPVFRHSELRMACDSPLKFTCKSWEFSAGPPFTPVRLPEHLRSGPINFLTDDSESFASWRDRPDLRSAAISLILRERVIAVSVVPGWLTAWWDADQWGRNRALDALPGILEGTAVLARMLDGKSAALRPKRLCPHCRAVLAPGNTFCTACGRRWWEAPQTSPQRR